MSLKQKLALEASAGSGKTFSLSIRYVSLLFLGAKPESILTLTFTNKASNEMSSRITSLLKELKNKDIELGYISEATGLSKEEILKRQPTILKSFLSSSINISTIDKFNTQILRSFSLYQGLMPDFQVGEGIDELGFLRLFIKEIKAQGFYKELIEFSVYEQKRLQDIFGYLKSLDQKRNELTNITTDTKYDIEQIKKDVWKNFLKIKEFFYSFEGINSFVQKAFDVEEIEDILYKTWIQRDTLEEYKYFKKYKPNMNDIFYELKNFLKSYLRAKEAYYKQKYLEIFNIYKETKRKYNIKTNSLEFDDITNFVYQVLRGGEIDSEFLYFRLDSRIEHILIDEFQDTSITQYMILEPLIEEITSGIGVKEFKSFFYVGDVKQSIYRFRGGVKELFHYVQKLFDVQVEILNINYRSKKRVVEFVNRVFRDRIKGYHDQLPKSDKDEGYIKVVEGEELLELVTAEVEFLLKSGVSGDDIAILTYANGDAFIIEEALLEKDPHLDITTSTTVLLINIPTVRAIIEFLKYLYFKENIYLSNFLSLIGRDIDTEVNSLKYNIDKQLQLLVKEIVRDFNIFYHDENILKFIEIIANFKDIEEFVFNCEDIAEPSPIKKQKGIKILTIHKSKGLEFKHVIVCDRFTKKPPDTSHFIYDYDGVKLKELYIRQKGRDIVDSEYKEAIDRQKLFQTEDELNTLYVAFTRAENSLVICQKDKNSSFALLNLSPFEEGDVIVENNDDKIEELEEVPYESIKTGFQDKTIKTDTEEKDISAINFGLALHYMLENLHTFSKESLESAFWAMKNRYELKLEDGEDKRIKQRVQNLLEDEAFLTLTDGKIYKELPLSFDGEIKQVDLLVEKEDKFVVIDYKSSDSIQSKHLKQVSYYKKVLESIFEKKVEGYVCYVRDSEVEVVKI